MIKRLKIISGVDPREGGPIEGIRQQAVHTAAMGIDEDIVCLDPPDAPWVMDLPQKVFALGEPLARARSWQKLLPWRRYGYHPDFVPWLRAHVHDYDLVMVHGLWNYATMGARRVLVGADVPYVVFTHGMLDPWFKRKYPIKNALKQFFWWFNEGPLLNNARFVLFTSEEEKLLARGAFTPYRVRERVIGYGTSDPGGNAAAQTSAFRALLPGLAKPYLLYLSRIHPKKGCDLLVDAFAEVFGANDDLDLVMAGPGSSGFVQNLRRQAVARGIGSRVHWPGMLYGEAKWGAFRNAEAFILPSHQENFGIAVAEAMACGVPTLITNKVNIWREVASAGAGLVDSDDVPGVERLLRRFLAMLPDERTQMRRRARAAFLELYEVTNAVATINAACRDAVSGFRVEGDPKGPASSSSI
ncbi:MAG: glycosyltransferase [Roseiarcus sp.]|jgi:glycosyltransferase involved in cell wall biosynthesis